MEIQESNEINAVMEDPLSSKMKLSARFAISVPSFIRSILKNASQVMVPTLILQGDVDNTVVPDGASRLLDTLASNDKSLKMFKDSDHSFYDSLPPRMNSKYDDLIRKQVYDTVADWLKVH